MVISLLGCVGYLSIWGGELAARFASLNAQALAEAGAVAVGGQALLIRMARLMSHVAHLVAPLIGIIVAGALVSAVLQTGFLFAPQALKVDFSRLNPAQGFKRIMSMQTLIESAKACFKMLVYTLIVYSVIRGVAITVAHAPLLPDTLARELAASGLHLLFLLLAAAFLFAMIDQVLVRRAFAKKMRMSRHEQKQEIKQREGDPRIKQRRRQLQRELLQRSRSMRAVRGADVLVTNPTHYAVGLQYDASRMAAPTVIAKGAGDFAQRLRKLAFIYGVPVIELPPFARELYFKAALEKEVPGNLYGQTAAIYLRIRRAASPAGAV